MIDVADLPESVQTSRAITTLSAAETPEPVSIENGTPTPSLEEHERQLVTQALAEAAGNQSRAARQLRIGRDALRYKMKKYGLL
jgi:DNA-binding NtrC family response regulator